MTDWVLLLVVPGACAILIGLMLDGAIPVPLHKLAQFPLRNRPATNGALFGTLIVICLVIAARLYGVGPYP